MHTILSFFFLFFFFFLRAAAPFSLSAPFTSIFHYFLDVNHEMDAGLHGWVSTPQYSRSCTKVHCSREGFCISTLLFLKFLKQKVASS